MLTKLQESFLDNYIKQSRYDQLTSERVKLKGKFLKDPDDLKDVDACIEEWSLVDVLDAGEGQRGYRCQCGKAIRHQYILEHKTKEITLKLGSTCYQKYVGIDVHQVERVIKSKEVIIAEREEIMDRFVTGFIDTQLFLLDYDNLSELHREQLQLGLPLSSKQEAKAYRDLNIEDEDKLVSRGKIIRSLSADQLNQLNNLTKEARQTIVARLVDGRILGVIDEVLAAAPDLFKDRYMVSNKAEHKLKDSLVTSLSQSKGSVDDKIMKNFNQIQRLIRLVDTGLEDEVVLVEVARAMLSEQQRNFWAGHTSKKDKLQLARKILTGANYIELEHIDDISLIPKHIWQHIKWQLPLTDQMMVTLYGESEDTNE